MIFKDDDVTDIAKDKKIIAIFNSRIFLNSNTPVDYNKKIKSKSLNFCKIDEAEANTLWMLDLESKIAIDCIRLSFEFHQNEQNCLQDIKVELSLDKQEWIKPNYSMFEYKDNANVLDINIYQTIKARYIKISLDIKSAGLKLKKCEVFVRKIKGLAIASLVNYSAYGDRLIAFLNAMYVAKHTGLKFAFGWKPLNLGNQMDNTKAKEIKPITIGTEEETFSENFIKQYSYTANSELNIDVFGPDFSHRKDNVEEYANCENSIYHYGYYFTHCFFLFVNNLSATYTKELKDLFEQIEFSDQIQSSINLAKDIFKCNFQQQETIAIHIRSGDIVYSNRRGINLYLAHNDKATPIEIALELVKRNLNKTIILFGEDDNTIKTIIEFIQNKYQKKIYFIKDFIPSGLNAIQIDFFEIIFMSCCKEIISPSGFARLASLIGNGEESKRWVNLFSLEEQFDIFSNNLDLIQVDDFQSAYSYFAFFMIAEKLGKNNDFLYDILKKAQSYDRENMLYKILSVDCLLRKDEYKKAESYFKTVMSEEYFSVYQLAFMSYVENIAFKHFDKNKLSQFPYLSYMMAKIYFLFKDYINANKYLKDALNKEKHNKLFLDLEKELQRNCATRRIQNHLAYKLGRAMIENSKSLKEYIKMPYILSYIQYKHRREQKDYKSLISKNPELKLPKIETYVDYNEAMKVKKHLSYKLGEVYMKACKTWYKGGFVRFYFEIKRLEREFKKQELKI